MTTVDMWDDGTPVRDRGSRSAGAGEWTADLDAEAALLGCILQGADPTIIDTAAWSLQGAQAVHHAVFAISDGAPIDLRLLRVQVGDELRQLHVEVDGRVARGDAALQELVAHAPRAASAALYADIVAKHHRARRVRGVISRADHALRRDDVDGALAAIESITQTVPASERSLHHVTLDEFLHEEDEEYDWVIPGVLERNDRGLITGGEGGGKSTFLRQFAVQAAAGIHPFTLEPIEPATVLLIDLENSKLQVKRMIRPLRITAGVAYDTDRLHLCCEPGGLDLTDREDAALLSRLIETVQPDLIVGGPVYKLVGGDPTEEQPAKAAAAVLDRLRAAHGFALLLETHQPHEASGGSKRPERPYGASLWKRWPEFGLHIGAVDKLHVAPLKHWRGARDERDWPLALQRGGDWPWTVPADRTLTFAFMLEVVRDYAFAHGSVPSWRQIEERSAEQGQRIPKSTAQRMAENNKRDWDAVCAEVTR